MVKFTKNNYVQSIGRVIPSVMQIWSLDAEPVEGQCGTSCLWVILSKRWWWASLGEYGVTPPHISCGCLYNRCQMSRPIIYIKPGALITVNAVLIIIGQPACFSRGMYLRPSKTPPVPWRSTVVILPTTGQNAHPSATGKSYVVGGQYVAKVYLHWLMAERADFWDNDASLWLLKIAVLLGFSEPTGACWASV